MGWRVLITALLFFTSQFISINSQAQICAYGIYSQDETNIRDRVTVSPGMIGSKNKIEIGVEADIKGTIISSGNTILRNNCIVEQSVYAGGTVTKQSGAAVSG
ncbi:MAG: hypothetical protein JXR91_12785, partial [Deltaproteobacteria bacterium]|nr:hypothetical protein [Deltaproteobacteria bacterium]